jgi:AraC family transcriptional regulator
VACVRPYAQDATFEKWGAAEVTSFSSMPEGMESYTLLGGKYAVFLHKGPASDTKIFRYIFGVWLPRSKWELDDREHFELLPPGYRPDDPNAEEEVWVPLR